MTPAEKIVEAYIGDVEKFVRDAVPMLHLRRHLKTTFSAGKENNEGQMDCYTRSGEYLFTIGTSGRTWYPIWSTMLNMYLHTLDITSKEATEWDELQYVHPEPVFQTQNQAVNFMLRLRPVQRRMIRVGITQESLITRQIEFCENRDRREQHVLRTFYDEGWEPAKVGYYEDTNRMYLIGTCTHESLSAARQSAFKALDTAGIRPDNLQIAQRGYAWQVDFTILREDTEEKPQFEPQDFEKVIGGMVADIPGVKDRIRLERIRSVFKGLGCDTVGVNQTKNPSFSTTINISVMVVNSPVLSAYPSGRHAQLQKFVLAKLHEIGVVPKGSAGVNVDSFNHHNKPAWFITFTLDSHDPVEKIKTIFLNEATPDGPTPEEIVQRSKRVHPRVFAAKFIHAIARHGMVPGVLMATPTGINNTRMKINWSWASEEAISSNSLEYGRDQFVRDHYLEWDTALRSAIQEAGGRCSSEHTMMYANPGGYAIGDGRYKTIVDMHCIVYFNVPVRDGTIIKVDSEEVLGESVRKAVQRPKQEAIDTISADEFVAQHAPQLRLRAIAIQIAEKLRKNGVLSYVSIRSEDYDSYSRCVSMSLTYVFANKKLDSDDIPKLDRLVKDTIANTLRISKNKWRAAYEVNQHVTKGRGISDWRYGEFYIIRPKNELPPPLLDQDPYINVEILESQPSPEEIVQQHIGSTDFGTKHGLVQMAELLRVQGIRGTIFIESATSIYPLDAEAGGIVPANKMYKHFFNLQTIDMSDFKMERIRPSSIQKMIEDAAIEAVPRNKNSMKFASAYISCPPPELNDIHQKMYPTLDMTKCLITITAYLHVAGTVSKHIQVNF